jgi:hypothetical protein
MNRGRLLLLGMLVVLMGIVAMWTYDSMVAAQKVAIAESENLVACRRMTAGIEAYQRRPVKAAEHVQLATETTGLIEKSARDASIDLRNLVRITPEPSRRVGDTVYKEKVTFVHLKNTTLKQLVALVHNLITAQQKLQVKTIRIAAPRSDDTGSWWTVELALTYLIYEPPKARK